MTIVFIHPHKAFLPEIDAYIDFFSKYQIKTIVAKPEETGRTSADVEWHFLGTDSTKRKAGVIKIHEYASASAPPFEAIKNFSKKILTVNPQYRLFLNNYVKEKFRFNDDIPSGFRDMGIADSFLHFDNRGSKKEYDFVYAGSVHADRKINRLLECFTREALKDKSILILSKDYDGLKSRFSVCPNIRFEGPVLHEDIPKYISKAAFAINFIADEEPFNQQTSTKLLEYAALKIPVITTDYSWARNFQKENGGNFFYLDKDLSNLNWENICKFRYSFPNLKEWAWENQIRKSGVLQFLESKFPGIFF